MELLSPKSEKPERLISYKDEDSPRKTIVVNLDKKNLAVDFESFEYELK